MKFQFFTILSFCILFPVTAPLRAQSVGVSVSNTKLPPSEGKTSVPVADTITLIEEKTLEFDGSMALPADPGGEISNGVRFYSFIIQPKEKLSLRLKAEAANRVGMQFLPPEVQDKMASQYQRLKLMPKTLSSSFQEITNITNEPYHAVLMVFGRVNHWFKVEIKRSK